MPKKIDHEQRKKEILREALELFSLKGYEATTLVDIAKVSKIARPTLYQYFRNKHQILFFASKQFTDEFLFYYRHIVEMKQFPAADRLRFILSHIVLSCREKRRELVGQSAFILKLEQEHRSIQGLVRKRTKPLKSLLFALMQEAEQNSELLCLDLPNAVDFLLSIVTSGLVYILLSAEEDCELVLQHIATVIQLLKQRAAQASLELNRPDSYPNTHAELAHFIANLKKEQEQQEVEEDSEDLDDEWQGFLDPFRVF